MTSDLLRPRICRLDLPLVLPDGKPWQRYPFFKGATPNLPSISAHASVLARGHRPHPPHQHEQEELLLLLGGEVELSLPAAPEAGGEAVQRLTAGEFVYYPAGFPHTLRTVSEAPAQYLMFRWLGDPLSPGDPLSFSRYRFSADENESSQQGFRRRLLFEGRMVYLQKLHGHTSTLSPGAGYKPHSDDHDVAIVLLGGEVATLGGKAGPHDVILCPAGKPHGMRNRGLEGARYLVFEFHGPKTPGQEALHRPGPSRAGPSRLAKRVAGILRAARAAWSRFAEGRRR